MQIELKKLSKDVRGELFNLKIPAKCIINIQTTNKGYARGGHSHIYDETFFVVTGKVEYHTGRKNEEHVRIYRSGSIIRTTPGKPHYIVAREFSVLIEIRPTGTKYIAKDYKPYRSIVLGLIDKKVE
jgi:uncharacterized RmlC-like cupin family protein